MNLWRKAVNKLRLALYAALIFAVGTAIGYYLMPDKVKIETKEKIVYKTKTTKEENKKVTEKFDPETGKVVERIEETGTKETTTDTIKNEKEKSIEKERTRKNYALKVGQRFSIDYKDLQVGPGVPVVGGEIRIPQIAFTPGWVGIELDSKLDAGLYLRWEF